jgi:hypothetical protein
MESKINIKELAKNLRNLNRIEANTLEEVKDAEEVLAPIVLPMEKVEITKVEKQVENKATTTKTAAKQTVEETVIKPKKEKREPIQAALPKEDPLAALLQADFELYDFSKQVWIDTEIYEVLVQIKRKKKIKNISVLVTSIIETYINQNKSEIVKLFDSKIVKQG